MDSLININTGIPIGPGKLLVSEPLLQDDTFHRSVIQLCMHDEKGSVGFVLNKLDENTLDFYFPDLINIAFPVYVGGPVETHTLHFLHSIPSLEGCMRIEKDIFWSGDLEQVLEGIKLGTIDESNCKFFMGYSGWDEGQLQAEIDMNAWLVAQTSKELIFHTDEKNLWNKTVKSLGKKYSTLLFMPDKPELN